MNKYKNTLFFAALAALTLSGCGGSSGSESTNSEAQIPPTNSAPTAGNDSVETVNGAVVTIEVMANDDDADGDAITITEVSDTATLGTVAINGDVLVYTPQTLAMGNDTFSYTISDGEDTASGQVTVTNNQSLVLSGLVTDSPVANAEVSITVNGETFTTQADDAGLYTLTITKSDDDGSLMTLSGRGVAEQSHISLVSTLSSFTDVLTNLTSGAASGGEERSIDSQSDPSLIISHVSTASRLLFDEYLQNGGKGTFDEFFKELNNNELISLAGFIKLLADNPQYPVPEGETTLSILEAGGGSVNDAITAFLDANGFVDEDGAPTEEHQIFLAGAIDETLNDETLSAEFMLDDVSGQRWAQFYSRKSLVNGGVVISFNEDGTGTSTSTGFTGDIQSLDFEWELDNGKLSMTYTSGNESEGFSYCGAEQDAFFLEQWGQDAVDRMAELCAAGQISQPRIINTQISDVLSKTSEASGVFRSVKTSSRSAKLLLTDSPADQFTNTTSFTSFDKFADMSTIVELTEETVSASDWAMFIPSQQEYFGHGDTSPFATDEGLMFDVVSLSNNGNLTTEFGRQTGTWLLEDGVLQLSYGDNLIHVTPILTFGSRLLSVFTLNNSEEVNTAFVAQLVPVMEDITSQVTLSSTLPNIWTALINGTNSFFWDESDKPSIDWLFGFHFSDDGTYGRYYPSFNDEKSFITDKDTFNWQWQIQGNTMRVEGEVTGFYERQREWRLLTIEEDVLYVLESFSYKYMDDRRPPTTVLPRLAPLKQYNWQTLYPEYWENRDFVSTNSPQLGAQKKQSISSILALN